MIHEANIINGQWGIDGECEINGRWTFNTTPGVEGDEISGDRLRNNRSNSPEKVRSVRVAFILMWIHRL
jgi:hypothetical protein